MKKKTKKKTVIKKKQVLSKMVASLKLKIKRTNESILRADQFIKGKSLEIKDLQKDIKGSLNDIEDLELEKKILNKMVREYSKTVPGRY